MALNLTAAVIVLVGGTRCPRAPTFAGMLQEQVYARTGLRWPVVEGNTTGTPAITLEAGCCSPVDWSSATPEGYTLEATHNGVSIVGSCVAPCRTACSVTL